MAHRLARSGATAGACLVAAGFAVYAAERRVVAGWAEAPDPMAGEPRKLDGRSRLVDATDGARIRVVEAGSGPAVVLVHGFTGLADHWAPVARRLLASGCRVVAFDQRGHGGSTAGPGGFSHTQLGHDLQCVLDAAAPEGAVVAGHSMGGIAIQSWLEADPRRARHAHGLVLASTLATPAESQLGRLMARLGGKPIARLAMGHPVHGRILARGGVGAQPSVTVLDRVRAGWVACPDDTRAAVMRELGPFDFTRVLRAVQVPTTVVCGSLDQVTPLAESRRMAELLPHGVLHVIDRAGHEVAWEAPDQLAALILDRVEASALAGT